MCVDVYVAALERWCSNYGELTDALGGTPALCSDGGPHDRAMCLCCVDMEATAEQFGKVIYDAGPNAVGMKDRKVSKRESRAAA